MFRFKPSSNSFLWVWILNAMTWRRQVQALQFKPIYRIKVKFLCFCKDSGYIGSFICMYNRISSGVTWGTYIFKSCPSMSLWDSVWWTLKIFNIAINVIVCRHHLYIMYGNASGASLWKKVRKECSRILKILFRFNSTFSPPT